jgi:hypothetical protein
MYTNYELPLNEFIYSVDFEITGKGCKVLNAIEAFENGSHRECLKSEILLIQLELDSKFINEIAEVMQFEEGNAEFENFCERADNFRG